MSDNNKTTRKIIPHLGHGHFDNHNNNNNLFNNNDSFGNNDANHGIGNDEDKGGSLLSNQGVTNSFHEDDDGKTALRIRIQELEATTKELTAENNVLKTEKAKWKTQSKLNRIRIDELEAAQAPSTNKMALTIHLVVLSTVSQNSTSNKNKHLLLAMITQSVATSILKLRPNHMVIRQQQQQQQKGKEKQ